MIRARIAFERELASHWHLALIAYGIVCVTVIANERWRDGWAILAAVLLPVVLAAAAMREGSGSDSWFRALGGSAVADTVGRIVGHAVLVGLPLAVHTILAADVIGYMIVNLRTYALVVMLFYGSLVAGRALVSSSSAGLVGPLALAISVAAGTGLGWVLVGAWEPQEGVLVRLAMVAVPLATLAVRWDVLGTWAAQVGRRKVWSRILVATTIAVAFLTAIEAADDRPLHGTWCDWHSCASDGTWCDGGRDGRRLCADSEIGRAWVVSDDGVRLLPERDVRDAILGPGGAYAVFVGDGSRAIFRSPAGAVAVLDDVDERIGFSPSGRWAVHTREAGITIVNLDGSRVVMHAGDAAWLGEELLLRDGFSFELLRADGERTLLADAVPAFVDPNLALDDRMLWPRGDGRVQLLTAPHSWRSGQVGFVAGHVADACARGPGCPGLLEPMSIPRFERVPAPEPQPAPPRARLAPVVAWLRG